MINHDAIHGEIIHVIATLNKQPEEAFAMEISHLEHIIKDVKKSKEIHDVLVRTLKAVSVHLSNIEMPETYDDLDYQMYLIDKIDEVLVKAKEE